MSGLTVKDETRPVIPAPQNRKTMEILSMVKLKRRVDIRTPSAEELIMEMKQLLPIPMYPLKSSIHKLKSEGLDIRPGQELLVTDVMDSGDFGGVVCCIESNKQFLVTSITHLTLKPDHPLSSKIFAYQRHRIKKLARQTRYEE